MNRPTTSPCTNTHARIIAHCSIRHCTLAGDRLRQLAGASGDITSMSPDVVASRFTGKQRDAALYMLRLADYIKSKSRRYHDEIA